MNDRWSDWFVIPTWIISIRRARRSVVVLVEILTVILIAAGCNLRASPEGVEAVTPRAFVSVTPRLFCPGEILTASYDGGPQVSSCGSEPDSQECKGASLTTEPRYPSALSFPFGYEPDKLHGSVSAPAGAVGNYTFTYAVEWETWSSFRDLRVPAQPDSGQTWTGRKSAWDWAYPVGDGETRLNYRHQLVCDEETHTWRWGTGDDGRAGMSRVSGTYWGGNPLPGRPSACVALTQVCINAEDAVYPTRVRVEGGPSVLLGGPDNPRCTDEFEGYQPDDIIIEPGIIRDDGDGLNNSWGESCNPRLENTHPPQNILGYYVAASSMCATGPVDEGAFPLWPLDGADQFHFGSIALRGAARDRCLAAMDPSFVAQIPLVPALEVDNEAYPPIPPLPIIACDIGNSCDDGACQAGCEDAVNCPQDCEPSDENCPSGTYFAPVTNRCIAIQIPTPKIENGGDGGDGGDGGQGCPAGTSWKCKTTTYPPVCGCQ